MMDGPAYPAAACVVAPQSIVDGKYTLLTGQLPCHACRNCPSRPAAAAAHLCKLLHHRQQAAGTVLLG